MDSAGRRRPWERLTRQALICRLELVLSVTAIGLLQPAFGPWLIWSSVSLPIGELPSSQRKGWDRAIGVASGRGLAALLVRRVLVNPVGMD